MEEQTIKGGLLQRAKKLLVESTPKFNVWATKNGFKHAGIFAPYKTEKTSSEYYFLSEIFGFSAKTVASSIASKDFWDGKLSKSFEWQCFSKNLKEISPFLDLFEEKIGNSISSLYFLPFKDKEAPMYFVIAEFEEDDSVQLPKAEETVITLKNIVDFQRDEEKLLGEIEENLDKGLEFSPAHLFILSLKGCMEKAFQDADIERKLSKFDMIDRIEIKERLIQSVTNATYSLMEPMFKSPNCLYMGLAGEIKIAIFSKEEQDDQMISFHFATALTDLLGDDATKQIVFLIAGICPNKKGTLSFLQKG